MCPDAYLEMAETEARHWWFAGRRAVLEATIRNIGLPSDATILEIGCGTGGNLSLLSAFGRICAVEMDATARTIANEKTGGRFDIRAGSCPDDVPFVGHRFDLICLFDVLEHIEEDVATLEALRKLLAPGGLLLLTVPAYQWLWSRHDEYLHHKRRYTARELLQKTAAAGLNVARLSYFNSLLLPLASAVRIKDRLLRAHRAAGTRVPPAILNSLLRWIFSAERLLLAHMDFPAGVSILAILTNE